MDVSDPIAVLLYLFGPGELPCEKAADFDDSGDLDVTDAIASVGYLFQGEAAPPAPFLYCGVDPTPDELTCARSACSELEGSIVLNEILASNAEGLRDEDGSSSDWIELHMPASATAPSVDLGGWTLVNSATAPGWTFPEGVRMRRGDYLVVFASGKDRRDPASELHTDFRLEASGEPLELVAPDGSVIDAFSPSYPEQLLDVSYGRVVASTYFLRGGDAVDYHVPTADDAASEASWMSPDFDASGWSSGASGLGFSSFSGDGFEVRFIQANVPVEDLAVAEEVARTPSLQAYVETETVTEINYLTSGDAGNFSGDRPFPSLDFEDVEDFVVVVTGIVNIPSTGLWTFGVSSNDGFRLVIDDGERSYSMSHPTTRATGNTMRAFEIERAGPHVLTLLHFQRSGGASLELFASNGAFETFNRIRHRLVGQRILPHAGVSIDVATDISAELSGINSSLWMRREFTIDDRAAFRELELRVLYADGFVAYLNGVPVARRNAPGTTPWDATATSVRPLFEILTPEVIDVTEHLGALRSGANVLAIHGLGASPAAENFLVDAEVRARDRDSTLQYMPTPTPKAENLPGARGFVKPVTFSVARGFFDGPFDLVFHSPTDDVEIRYTTDGSTPSATNGQLYGAPLRIEGTSTIRAVGLRPDFLDSTVTTSTYLFLDDVIRQSPSGQAPGPGWPTSNVNGQVLNYGMDPDVVDDVRWSDDILDALRQVPSISLVTDLESLFGASEGIYVNAGNDGRAWERRTSVELLVPPGLEGVVTDGAPGFAVEAGLRIRGAASRRSSNPKHSFRLFFRREYGTGRLRYPLFGGEGVDEFDKIDLRTSQNYSWAMEGSDQNTFIREVFSRDAQRDMRQPYTRSRYYHLYINGVYWGLFETQERADAEFAQSYLGGGDGDYDVVKNDSSGSRALEATNGTLDAYRRLYDAAVAGFSSDASYRRVQGLLPDGSPDPQGDRLLDPVNLMDYMACTYYTGDPDAPVSAWAHFSNNIFAIYDREKPDGFQWFRHDAEHSLGANGGVEEGRLLTDSRDRSIGQEWRHFNPAWLHLRLGENREYALHFADRVRELFFDGGALSEEANAARWNRRRYQIDLAVIGASARWGDARGRGLRTKIDWERQNDYMLDTFFPQRTQIVMDQMRSVDMFPDQAIVDFSQHGGDVDAGFALSMSLSNGTGGTIWFTTNGEDPRLWGGDVNPSAEVFGAAGVDTVVVDETMTVCARVRDGADWGAMTRARFHVGLAGLAINEVMASNQTTLEDPVEPGEYPDWIEIYNGGPSAVDLGGMYLSDDPQNLTKWRIAEGISIGVGEYGIFFADDDGTQGPLHTNFQLSQSGETIVLTDSDGVTVIDEVTFDQQMPDVAYGRSPDGTGDWGVLEAPTPADPNRGRVD